MLERRVEGLPNAVEPASERQALLVMVEDREDRRDGIALPDDVDRVDLVGEPPVDHPVGDRDPTVLAHEPAVRVQDDVALMRGGRVPTDPEVLLRLHRVDESLDLGRGAGHLALVREAAARRDVDDVVLQAQQVGARRCDDRPARGHDRAGDHRESGLRDAGAGDPGVVAVLQPVLVRQGGVAVVTPRGSPRVLHEEADVVVAGDEERMAAGLLVGGFDHEDRAALVAPGLRRPPAVVDRRRDRDRVELADRRLHVVDAPRVDAVVRPQRDLEALGDEVRIRHVAGPGVGPQVRGADAVVVPALEGAAERGADVGSARELVVAPGHRVEHVRADVLGLPVRRSMPGRLAQRLCEDRVDEPGDRMASARLALLVEERNARSLVLLIRQELEARPVHEVVLVERIRQRVRRDRSPADRQLARCMGLDHRTPPPIPLRRPPRAQGDPTRAASRHRWAGSSQGTRLPSSQDAAPLYWRGRWCYETRCWEGPRGGWRWMSRP